MPSIRGWCGAVALVLSCALPAPASGQSAVPQQEPDRLRRGGEALDAIQDAQAEALDLDLLAGGEASWADVLARPDDVETSLRFARRQVREGQLRGAAATLERILLLQPELAPVRLLYAVVLFRLDSLAEAARELDLLAEAPLTAAERDELERYRKAVRHAARRTRVDASLTFGTQYETNRNSAPSSGTRLAQLGDLRLELDVAEDSDEQDDAAFFGLTRLAFEHDLGLHEGHALLGSFSTYLSRQLDLRDFDTRAYAVELGGRYRSRLLDVTPLVFGGIVELSSQTFLKNAGLDLALERQDGPRRDFRGGLRVEWQDFDPVHYSETSHEHTGLRGELSVGASFRPSPVHQLDGDFVYVVKDARGSATPHTNDVFSWDGPQLSARHTWLLGAGRFLIAELSAGRDSYWRPDQRITSQRCRRDVRTRASLVFGLPLEALLPGSRLPNALSELVLSLGATYQRVDSNIANYEYDDTRLSFVVSRQWSF